MDDSREDYLCINDPNGNWSECEAHVDPALEAFRRKLKYFFMNPCDKYKARQRKPWKLFLQIVKIAVVTVQLVSFGLSNQMVVQFKEENLLTFRHLFLKNYSESNTNTYAIYTQLDVYTHITHIVQQFLMLPSITVGNHEYEQEGDVYTPLCICQQFYHNGSISPANETFDIDSRVDQECSLIYPQDPFTESPLNFTLHFERLLSVTVNFTLKAINLETVEYHELPDCYVFNIMIQFDNKAHSGRILVDLDNEVHIYECSDWSMTGASRNMYMMVLFDAVVILILSTSLLLCIRSVKAGVLLQKEYSEFSLRRYRKCVSLSERLEFINGWYLLIIVSDVLTISGSVLKIVIQLKAVASYDLCSILLGTGTMLVWIGVLRYMGYLKKYNSMLCVCCVVQILIITLRVALPNVIRFTCCAAMIYLGYCFCGWIVLGPYHTKFRTLNTVSESLFSLINGDDMFATFKNMQQKSFVVWLFSRLYLYTFVSLFIYMVLSLFITLITDTYDTIKHQQLDGEPVSDLQAFVLQCKDLPDSGEFSVEKTNSISSTGGGKLMCCCSHRSSDSDEDTHFSECSS
ncbi:mucolipin-3 isoform X2 [Danio rerio]|uniref:Mucolipin-3 isoform X2 n=1 Tax=Danio rerio TaxID=7955 RepID=A0AC58IN12_DANRE|nr:mucolipin-3 isoform X2 [Danio rerio]|eukprot:XP_021325745.1 mucolipin-3 isoform X2 [Danio rerio]